jgi:hypothetical protein
VRKQREISYDIIEPIKYQLREELLAYKESDDDPKLPVVSKVPIFEECKSFSIVVENINYFGFGSESQWLN